MSVDGKMSVGGRVLALVASMLLAGATASIAQVQLTPQAKMSPIAGKSGNAVLVPLPGAAQAPGQSPALTVATTPAPPLAPIGCRPLEEIVDRDGDLQRNLAALSTDDLCLKMDVFREGGQTWILRIIQHKRDPGRILWFVPHDNENDAFDSAVYALKRYRGTIVAVENGGDRFNGEQDPNRNFQVRNVRKRCLRQMALSPIYTERVMRWHKRRALIFALHTNEPGYTGDGQGGIGLISMAKPAAGTTLFPAQGQALGLSPDDTMVFVASTAPPQSDRNLMAFVHTLQQNQINVIYETVSAERNDCSMSRYAALTGRRDYLNLEVVQSDGETQRTLLDRVLELMPPKGFGPILPESRNKKR